MEARVIGETPSYAAVYKPPFMHTAPLREGEGGTLAEWFGALFPPALEITGRKKIEGGLLYRLDFETDGLVLVAKNQRAFDALLLQQEEGRIVKEYGAVVFPRGERPPGFPPPPVFADRIESRFRPYGKGRKAVRPVTEGRDAGSGEDNAKGKKTAAGKPYVTEILARTDLGGPEYVRLRIRKGFRHQIRCHLAWIGAPILNDALYGPGDADGTTARRGAVPEREGLALRCEALFFTDPLSGERREYRAAPLVFPS
ncbi:MAG: RNA pseudouridine synthase [Treponema sp.]|nr:RNA pseudouridine synthase [Treponema sp.]